MSARDDRLLPPDLRQRLATDDVWSAAHLPILKLYDPIGTATWLIAAADGDRLYGLCDLGIGEPGIGVTSLRHLSGLEDVRRVRICRDPGFKSGEPLSVWLRVARRTGSIVAAEVELQCAGTALALARCDVLGALQGCSRLGPSGNLTEARAGAV